MTTPPPPPPPAAYPPPTPPPATPSRQYPVLFWPRVGATLVDMLILTLVNTVIIGVLVAVGFAGAAAGSDAVVGTAVVLGMLALWGLMPLVSLGYYIHFLTRGATPGKRLAGLRVQRDDGTDPGFGPAAGRVLLLGLLGPVALIGLLHGDRRGYHDLVVDLHVVRHRH